MESRNRIGRDQFKSFEKETIFRHLFPGHMSKVFGKVGGGDREYKVRLIQSMTPGQRSIFAFMAIYFHNVLGWNLFLYGFASDIEQGFFKMLKDGLNHLEDQRLNEIVTRVETRYHEIKMIDPNSNRFEDLDSEYEAVKSASLDNAVNYIKNNTDEFFIFESGTETA